MNNLKKWRESASLILVAKTTYYSQTLSSNYNYKVLTLKRSDKSTVLGGTYVFPGGIAEKADNSTDWMKLYRRFGFKPDAFEELISLENTTNTLATTNTNEIPKYLSLRITAIRETFEESGILLCRSSKINYENNSILWGQFIAGHEIFNWQKKVHNDPFQFLKLCTQLEVYPDVWSLKDWSNWATPVSISAKFDTIFFITAFPQIPPTCVDMVEAQDLQWKTPVDYINQNRAEKIILPPPQFYELSRLCMFPDINNLSRFAQDRGKFGLERYLPYRINTDTAVYSILPGDDLYPKNIDTTDETMPYMKYIPQTKSQNRIQHNSIYQNLLITKNFTPLYNHIAPIANKL